MISWCVVVGVTRTLGEIGSHQREEATSWGRGKQWPNGEGWEAISA